MSWLHVFQWPAGFVLMLYGLSGWSAGCEALLSARVSGWKEKTRLFSPLRFLLGLLAGAAFQGKAGIQYCKGRYLAGYLTTSGTVLFAWGMAVGLFAPALVLMGGGPSFAYVLLIAGMGLQLAGRSPAWRSGGQAISGLGLCWVGYLACRSFVLPDAWVAEVLYGAGLLAAFFVSPTAFWLGVMATYAAGQMDWLVAGLLLMGLGGIWLVVLFWVLRGVRCPFLPVSTFLQPRELPHPARALGSVVQENRRMAKGLVRAAQSLRSRYGAGIVLRRDEGLVRDVEQGMDAYKLAAQRYLMSIARSRLDERQSRQSMHLFLAVGDLERISDHLLKLAENLGQLRHPAEYPSRLLVLLDEMLASIAAMLEVLLASMGSDGGAGHGSKVVDGGVERAREHALQILEDFTAELQDQILQRAITPGRAIRMQELRSHFERLIRHVRAVLGEVST